MFCAKYKTVEEAQQVKLVASDEWSLMTRSSPPPRPLCVDKSTATVSTVKKMDVLLSGDLVTVLTRGQVSEPFDSEEKKVKKVKPAVTPVLDELFNRTEAKPHFYYLSLSEKQVRDRRKLMVSTDRYHRWDKSRSTRA